MLPMKRPLLIAVVATMFVAIVPMFPAWAQQSSQDWTSCKNEGDAVALDVQIAACTAIIASRVDSKNMAIAYDKRGVAYDKNGDYDHAIADLNQSIKLNARDPVVFSDLGDAYTSKGEYDAAIPAFTNAIVMNPKLAAAFIGRGNAELGKNDYGPASSDFEQAMGSIQSWRPLLLAGVPSTAVRETTTRRSLISTRQLALDPKSVRAITGRGDIYFFKRDYDHAIADYSQAIGINPRYSPALFDRALAYGRKNDLDHAIADYTEVLRIDPQKVAAYDNRGALYRLKGDYDHAIADFDAAIRLNPQDASAYTNRCWTRVFFGRDLPTAIPDCDESVKRARDANAYGNRCDLNFKLEQFDSAIADCTEALTLDPKFAGSLYVRGLAKRKKGDPSAAEDIAAAKALRDNVDAEYASYGIK